MLHEYAIAPELLKKWADSSRDYREFFREYGLGSPRIPSSFPRQIVRKCRSYFLSDAPADEQSLHARRYLEMVDHLVETMICRDGVLCDDGDWNCDVLIEDMRAPFHAVLSPTQLDSPRSLTPETMYSQESHWNHIRQDTVARSYAGIAPHLIDMIRLARDKVVLIDSYGWNSRAISFITKLLGDCCNNRVSSQLPSVLVYYKEKIGRGSSPSASPSAAQVKQLILGGLPNQARRMDVSVYELRELSGADVFHNRCILTEHGGVTLGHGVDVSEDDNHSDEITLMGKAVYDKKWSQFVDSLGFDIVSKA